MPFDTAGIDPALEGAFTVDGIEIGPDQEIATRTAAAVTPAFAHLVAHVKSYSPEWAAKICDVPAASIRRVTNEFLAHARVGETIEIEGMTLPFRPVAIAFGKTVNNGWGGYECCWARTLIPCLVGALDVPGGTLGTTVRLNRPADNRWSSVKPGPDGFMYYPMNPTGKDDWISRPTARSAHRTLVPLVANSAWSQALGPTHMAWMMQKEDLDHLPHATPPDVWIVYRTNPAISFWDTKAVGETMAKFPFTICFAMTRDETNHVADVLLARLHRSRRPAADADRRHQIYRAVLGPSGLRAARSGGAAAGRGEGFHLDRHRTGAPHRPARSLQHGDQSRRRRRQAQGRELRFFARRDQAAQRRRDLGRELPRGERGADRRRRKRKGSTGSASNGFRVKPFSRLMWYLYPKLVEQNLRFEQPYQERLLRVGKELERRLHEHGITWWDKQLAEYEALPHWRDLGALWEDALAKHFKVQIADYPFWLITSRSMQYSWGNNVGIQLIKEVADNVMGHGSVVMNESAAEKLGIADGDLVEVRSPLNSTKGKVMLREGIRPDTLLIIGQFDHWVTPYAKDFHAPSMNALVPMLLDLTDATGSSADLVKVKITRLESGVMTRWAMVADLERCVGCQTCTAACRHANATSPAVQWRKVLDIEAGSFPNVNRTFVPVGCQHCADPPCMHVCPSTATRQRADGIVTIDYDICIGCAYCDVACPYQARFKITKEDFAYGAGGDAERDRTRDFRAPRRGAEMHVLLRPHRFRHRERLGAGLGSARDAGLRQCLHRRRAAFRRSRRRQQQRLAAAARAQEFPHACRTRHRAGLPLSLRQGRGRAGG